MSTERAKEQAIIWFDQATEQLRAAMNLYVGGNWGYCLAGLTQSAELAVKAALFSEAKDPGHRHNIGKLADGLGALNKKAVEPVRDRLHELSIFYLGARYPADDAELPPYKEYTRGICDRSVPVVIALMRGLARENNWPTKDFEHTARSFEAKLGRGVR